MPIESLDSLAWTVRRIARRWRSLLAFDLAFRLIELALLGPLTAWTLGHFLRRWGRAAVGNFEILAFGLSPPGLAALVVSGTIAIAALYLEVAGGMRLLADDRLAWWQGLSGPARRLPGIVRLGLRQLVAYLLLAAPFLAAIGGVYAATWSDQDLYGLIVRQPPIFWIGAGLAAGLVAVYAVLAGRLFLRWLLALPTLLFEPGTSAPEALRRSVERSRGRFLLHAAALGLWAAAQLAITAATMGALRLGAIRALDRLGPSLEVALPATAAILAVNAVVATGLSILGSITFSGVVLSLYRRAVGMTDEAVDVPVGRRRPAPWLIAGGLAALAALALFLGLRSLKQLGLDHRLEITAHRAGKGRAPENTIAALRRAIEDGADWAEIDVQRTADGALVVLHDTDLKRVGGDPRRVAALSLEEIREIDVGSWFGPEFAGERVPVFAEVLREADNRIRLNVELKPIDRNDVAPLTRGVVQAIQDAGMVGRCRICSQSYDGLMLARTLEPSLNVGFIVATSLGDPTALDVDFLMVRFDRITPDLVRHAGLRRMGVHAWTVSDPAWIGRLFNLGVRNVITDDVPAMRARSEEIHRLDPVERLLLRVRDALTE